MHDRVEGGRSNSFGAVCWLLGASPFDLESAGTWCGWMAVHTATRGPGNRDLLILIMKHYWFFLFFIFIHYFVGLFLMEHGD